MAGSPKIVSALRANWLLNVVGLALSFAASIVLVRTLEPALFAEYSAVLAIVGLATFVFEIGANSGLTRYLHEASQHGARGTFYRAMQRRRFLAAALCALLLIALGPLYARSTEFSALADQRGLFLLIAAIVAATLTRLLAHYGLIALFETTTALLLQQGFQIARAVALAVIALSGGRLPHLVGALLVLALVEAVIVHTRLWRQLRGERAPMPPGFVASAQKFGLLTVLDKAAAMLGSGSVLMLALAPHHAVAQMALLGLAVDLVGKLVSVTVMPMGNLVAPYLSQTSDDAAAQALATGRVVKLSSLLYCFTIGLGALVLPAFVALVYGPGYREAAGIALLLLLPTAYENWIRGSCSPALLRNRRGRELMRVNGLQAIVTVVTLLLVVRQPLPIAVLAVGIARALPASLNLLLLRRIVPGRTYLVPLQGLLFAILAALIGSELARILPLPELARTVVAAALFTLLFYAGVRWLILRDADTLRLAHRLVGSRIKFLRQLLPPLPAVPS
jgi:O-antigen/teichoic acid export membrane protein